MIIHPVVAELFHADGRTDIHYEANSPLRNFAGGSKNPRHVGRSCINIDVFDFDIEICIDVSVIEESGL
jgi:hypothetical protein